MKAVRIDVWSDIACPWCWVGKRHLEAALDHRPPDALVWRAFELNPRAPRQVDPAVPYVQRLARKYGVSEAEGQAMVDRMTAVGAEVGLDLRFDRVQPTNTFDAHRLLHWAKEHGRQTELKEAFFKAYMTDGQRLGEADVLVSLVETTGLDGDRARAILAGDAYAEAVRKDELAASELSIRGVPFFVFAGRLAVPGAQPAEILREALNQATGGQADEARSASDGATDGG